MPTEGWTRAAAPTHWSGLSSWPRRLLVVAALGWATVPWAVLTLAGASVAWHRWPEAMAGVLFAPRAATAAVSLMGLLAAMLAVTGIFGVAAYHVSRRMKELGIRVALGASRRHVLGAAVGRPMVMLGVGSLLGLLLSTFAGRLLGQIVSQANPQDPVVMGGAVLTMALLGVAAATIPALRALAVNHAKLLREE